MSTLPFSTNPLRNRADAQRLVGDLVAPLLPHFSAGRAQVRLGENRGHFGDPAGWLEGFARPLWGLVPLAAGGGNFDHWQLWQTGLAAGTDPADTEYWGIPGDFDQRSVEQAALGFALALAPEKTWEPLSSAARTRLVAWLHTINRVRLVQNNWLFFRVLVNLGLRRCGQACDEKQVAEDLDQLDRFYVGGGWYSDGASVAPNRDGRFGDYYVPMAFHFYGLIYARLAGDRDPVRAARYIERAKLFALDFQHWFAADGSALPFGRSLTYRFAQGAFWGALAFAGVEALPWGVIKGLYLRHLRWWMNQPIFSETGLLTIGYTYPNLLMAESYNSSASPYWALKTFLPLALPETHPFWQAVEQPLPPRKTVHTVVGAKLILVTDPRTHDVTAINPGQPVLDWPRHASHKYSKSVYSTRFAFSVPASVPTAAEGGLDSGLSLSDDGRYFRARENCLDPEVNDGVAYSRWEPWPEVELRTWLIADASGHVRIHRLRTGRKLWTIEAGSAVCWFDKTKRQLLPAAEFGPLVRSPQGSSFLRNLHGERRADCVDLGANSHLLSSLSAMPVLHSAHDPGEQWLATWVSGSSDANESFPMAAEFSFEITKDGGAQLLRSGSHWWRSGDVPCGESSAARHESLIHRA